MDNFDPKNPIRTSMLPYGSQWLDDEDREAVMKVLRGDFITQGPAIAAFEQAIAEHVGARYAVAFSNGTAALHGACFAAGIGPGDEVITSPITFLASSNCVLYQGGKPVFADIDPHTYNIDPDRVEERITSRTRAIIPVDFTGQPAEMDRIMALAEKHNLVVIEDAAHSLGASYKGRKVGSIAHMTMFSFHPVKHITTGEGGMIVTDDEEYYRKLLLFRNHGMTRNPEELERNDGPWYYEMHALGFNYRMTDLQAALGSSQLRKLDRFVQQRRDIARTYNEAFEGIPGLVMPKQHPDADSSWHLYVLRWETENFRATRREIFEGLRAQNIGVNVHYIPVYRQPYYKGLGYSAEGCPNAEQYYETAISLPIFPRMTADDVRDVIQAVTQTTKQLRERG
ncbi:UDP-4-amino-4,6-dideoxy-N-acetyl-beta-L-altrosamine transaminase [Cohnella xylanilytica]|uniref:UDP-4-amino-4, 6-dideoxy-N-acetyl-beta-L-altrosamine transaminase n=1 Tax=Cohnella xylanilytica TaxID=557555 RepID=A0A841TYP5_9BACL|nr:UDP-4-amino-4,6-dideoxy-N-acetyl-beta-L-altrosamine transaminase [Cohnella xylanilytica]MBB6692222.1 UDP-4-amino-4,6-dideoxy-N-acetyl-beta-L-altrosamine transaminase [Cohnella xylanilytica]